MTGDRPLQLGGAVNPRQYIYIERQEDEAFLQLLLSNEYVNVLASRQMGKSSLKNYAMPRLAEHGVLFAEIELAGTIGTQANIEGYYTSLMREIVQQLRLKIDLGSWWDAGKNETPNQKLKRFFLEIVGGQIDKPVVIFLDEIDSTLILDYTDDLFTAIRSMYNERARVEVYERISFCLLGVATPNELVKNQRTTAYNIGAHIELRDFDASANDLTALAAVLNSDNAVGDSLLRRVLYWTGGQPYLTSKLCAELGGVSDAQTVDDYIGRNFDNLDELANDIHFSQVLRFFNERLPEEAKAKELYARIVTGEAIRDQTSAAHAALKLSGLVKRDARGYLIVRNRIYDKLFGASWIGELSSPRDNLPPDVAHFAGRATEEASLLESLRASGGPVALRGIGGIGKTTLAVRVARQLADEYPDGRIRLNLRGTDPNPVTSRAAMEDVIRRFEPGAELPESDFVVAEIYRDLLARYKCLLILDNAADSAQAEELLPPAPSAAIVTARPHLDLPSNLNLDLNSLARAEAVFLLTYLFTERAASETPDVGMLDALAAACADHPLALVVAGIYSANRAGRLDLQHYTRQIEESRDVLKLGGLDDHDVMGSLALSLDRLSDKDADMVARWRDLAVFSVDFDADAVAAVWLGIDADATLVDLQRLAAQGLLEAGDTPTRFRLHPLMRDLARRDQPPDRREAAELRHAEHFLEVLSNADELYLRGGSENVEAGLVLFDVEQENIRAGQAHAVAALWSTGSRQPWPPEALGELVFRYANAGSYVLALRLHPGERIAWGEEAVAGARHAGNREGEGIALGNLGFTFAELGEMEKAIQFHEQALALAGETGDRRSEGAMLGNLGTAYDSMGQVEQAIAFHEQALVIAREIGDRIGEGARLGSLGNTYVRRGEVDKAIDYYQQSLEVSREIGNRHGESQNLGNLGIACIRLGQTEQAISFFDQQLFIAREIGDRRGEGNALGNLGDAYLNLGEKGRAIDNFEQALKIARETGDRRSEGNVLANLGNTQKNLGRLDEARASWRAALSLFKTISDPSAATVRDWLEELQA